MGIHTKSQENILINHSVDTGKLLQSSRVEFVELGENGTYRAEIIYWAPYADAIEYGSPPHWIPPSELEGWVRRKIGEKDRKKALGIAFAIANTIAKNGVEPKPYFRSAFESVLNQRGSL